MPVFTRIKRKISLFLVFIFTICLILLPNLTWVNAQKAPKPKPQDWHISGIIAALDDSDPKVQEYALSQLARYETQDLKTELKKPENVAQKAAKILKDKNVESYVRGSAASALGKLGDAAKPYVKDIADVLKDKNVDSRVRGSAASALGNLGDAAKPYVKDIADVLKDNNVESYVHGSAASALGNLGDAAKPYVKDIADVLKDKNVDSRVRGSAASALGNLGDAAKPYVKDIADVLKDKNVDINVRGSAASALGKIKQLELKEFLLVLYSAYYDGDSNVPQWRWLTYFLSGGTDEAKTLLKWVGKPQTTPEKLTHSEAKKTLKVFREAWEVSKNENLPELRNDLEKQIAVVAAYKNIRWQPQDITLLGQHYKNLKKINSTHAETIQSVIIKLEGWRWFFNFRDIILTHVAFWLALIFAYPKFPQIQAIFFWNPWVRRIGGMGYVGFLLTWVPFLRRKLLQPFQPS